MKTLRSDMKNTLYGINGRLQKKRLATGRHNNRNDPKWNTEKD